MATAPHEPTADWAPDGVDPAPVVGLAVVALAHLGALFVAPTEPSLAFFIALEGGALAVLAAVAWWQSGTARAALPVVGFGALAVSLVWLTVSNWSLPVATLAVAGAFTVLAYVLHRYELVALGLVEAER